MHLFVQTSSFLIIISLFHSHAIHYCSQGDVARSFPLPLFGGRSADFFLARLRLEIQQCPALELLPFDACNPPCPTLKAFLEIFQVVTPFLFLICTCGIISTATYRADIGFSSRVIRLKANFRLPIQYRNWRLRSHGWAQAHIMIGQNGTERNPKQ